MKTLIGVGAEAEQIVFTAPVDGLYLITGYADIADVTGTGWLHIETGISDDLENSIALNFGLHSTETPTSTRHGYAQLFLLSGEQIATRVRVDVGVSNSAAWTLALRVQLLGSPDLAVE